MPGGKDPKVSGVALSKKISAQAVIGPLTDFAANPWLVYTADQVLESLRTKMHLAIMSMNDKIAAFKIFARVYRTAIEKDQKKRSARRCCVNAGQLIARITCDLSSKRMRSDEILVSYVMSQDPSMIKYIGRAVGSKRAGQIMTHWRVLAGREHILALNFPGYSDGRKIIDGAKLPKHANESLSRIEWAAAEVSVHFEGIVEALLADAMTPDQCNSVDGVGKEAIREREALILKKYVIDVATSSEDEGSESETSSSSEASRSQEAAEASDEDSQPGGTNCPSVGEEIHSEPAGPSSSVVALAGEVGEPFGGVTGSETSDEAVEPPEVAVAKASAFFAITAKRPKKKKDQRERRKAKVEKQKALAAVAEQFATGICPQTRPANVLGEAAAAPCRTTGEEPVMGVAAFGEKEGTAVMREGETRMTIFTDSGFTGTSALLLIEGPTPAQPLREPGTDVSVIYWETVSGRVRINCLMTVGIAVADAVVDKFQSEAQPRTRIVYLPLGMDIATRVTRGGHPAPITMWDLEPARFKRCVRESCLRWALTTAAAMTVDEADGPAATDFTIRESNDEFCDSPEEEVSAAEAGCAAATSSDEVERVEPIAGKKKSAPLTTDEAERERIFLVKATVDLRIPAKDIGGLFPEMIAASAAETGYVMPEHTRSRSRADLADKLMSLMRDGDDAEAIKSVVEKIGRAFGGGNTDVVHAMIAEGSFPQSGTRPDANNYVTSIADSARANDSPMIAAMGAVPVEHFSATGESHASVLAATCFDSRTLAKKIAFVMRATERNQYRSVRVMESTGAATALVASTISSVVAAIIACSGVKEREIDASWSCSPLEIQCLLSRVVVALSPAIANNSSDTTIPPSHVAAVACQVGSAAGEERNPVFEATLNLILNSRLVGRESKMLKHDSVFGPYGVVRALRSSTKIGYVRGKDPASEHELALEAMEAQMKHQSETCFATDDMAGAFRLIVAVLYRAFRQGKAVASPLVDSADIKAEIMVYSRVVVAAMVRAVEERPGGVRAIKGGIVVSATWHAWAQIKARKRLAKPTLVMDSAVLLFCDNDVARLLLCLVIKYKEIDFFLSGSSNTAVTVGAWMAKETRSLTACLVKSQCATADRSVPARTTTFTLLSWATVHGGPDSTLLVRMLDNVADAVVVGPINNAPTDSLSNMVFWHHLSTVEVLMPASNETGHTAHHRVREFLGGGETTTWREDWATHASSLRGMCSNEQWSEIIRRRLWLTPGVMRAPGFLHALLGSPLFGAVFADCHKIMHELELSAWALRGIAGAFAVVAAAGACAISTGVGSNITQKPIERYGVGWSPTMVEAMEAYASATTHSSGIFVLCEEGKLRPLLGWPRTGPPVFTGDQCFFSLIETGIVGFSSTKSERFDRPDRPVARKDTSTPKTLEPLSGVKVEVQLIRIVGYIIPPENWVLSAEGDSAPLTRKVAAWHARWIDAGSSRTHGPAAFCDLYCGKAGTETAALEDLVRVAHRSTALASYAEFFGDSLSLRFSATATLSISQTAAMAFANDVRARGVVVFPAVMLRPLVVALRRIQNLWPKWQVGATFMTADDYVPLEAARAALLYAWNIAARAAEHDELGYAAYITNLALTTWTKISAFCATVDVLKVALGGNPTATSRFAAACRVGRDDSPDGHVVGMRNISATMTRMREMMNSHGDVSLPYVSARLAGMFVGGAHTPNFMVRRATTSSYYALVVTMATRRFAKTIKQGINVESIDQSHIDSFCSITSSLPPGEDGSVPMVNPLLRNDGGVQETIPRVSAADIKDLLKRDSFDAYSWFCQSAVRLGESDLRYVPHSAYPMNMPRAREGPVPRTMRSDFVHFGWHSLGARLLHPPAEVTPAAIGKFGYASLTIMTTRGTRSMSVGDDKTLSFGLFDTITIQENLISDAVAIREEELKFTSHEGEYWPQISHGEEKRVQVRLVAARPKRAALTIHTVGFQLKASVAAATATLTGLWALTQRLRQPLVSHDGTPGLWEALIETAKTLVLGSELYDIGCVLPMAVMMTKYRSPHVAIDMNSIVRQQKGRASIDAWMEGENTVYRWEIFSILIWVRICCAAHATAEQMGYPADKVGGSSDSVAHIVTNESLGALMGNCLPSARSVRAIDNDILVQAAWTASAANVAWKTTSFGVMRACLGKRSPHDEMSSFNCVVELVSEIAIRNSITMLLVEALPMRPQVTSSAVLADSVSGFTALSDVSALAEMTQAHLIRRATMSSAVRASGCAMVEDARGIFVIAVEKKTSEINVFHVAQLRLLDFVMCLARPQRILNATDSPTYPTEAEFDLVESIRSQVVMSAVVPSDAASVMSLVDRSLAFFSHRPGDFNTMSGPHAGGRAGSAMTAPNARKPITLPGPVGVAWDALIQNPASYFMNIMTDSAVLPDMAAMVEPASMYYAESRLAVVGIAADCAYLLGTLLIDVVAAASLIIIEHEFPPPQYSLMATTKNWFLSNKASELMESLALTTAKTHPSILASVKTLLVAGGTYKSNTRFKRPTAVGTTGVDKMWKMCAIAEVDSQARHNFVSSAMSLPGWDGLSKSLVKAIDDLRTVVDASLTEWMHNMTAARHSLMALLVDVTVQQTGRAEANCVLGNRSRVEKLDDKFFVARPASASEIFQRVWAAPGSCRTTGVIVIRIDAPAEVRRSTFGGLIRSIDRGSRQSQVAPREVKRAIVIPPLRVWRDDKGSEYLEPPPGYGAEPTFEIVLADIEDAALSLRECVTGWYAGLCARMGCCDRVPPSAVAEAPTAPEESHDETLVSDPFLVGRVGS